MRVTREKFKIYDNVFDNFTLRNLFKLGSQGHFDELKSPVALGKEANVFTANTDEGSIIVKIYRLESCNFNQMYNYIKADSRYNKLQHQKRQIVFAWTQREYRNLLKARQAGVNVPKPLTFKDNIVLMEMIGDDMPAPQLKDSPPDNIRKFYDLLVADMKKLHKCGLVHGDLSKFNILIQNERPVLIDFSQSTIKESYNYDELLQRDCRNIDSYFSKLIDIESTYAEVTENYKNELKSEKS